MAILKFSNPGVESSAWQNAAGSRVGVSQWAELLMLKGTTTVDSNGDWNSGTYGSTAVVAGTLYPSISGNPGTWDSKVYDMGLHSAFLKFTAKQNLVGGTIGWYMRTGTVNGLDSLPYVAITQDSLLSVKSGQFFQIRCTLDPTGLTGPFVDNWTVESWYAPGRDPLAGAIQYGDISQRIERLLNEFVAEIGDVTLSNQNGWWNYDGKMTLIQGTLFSRMSRNAPVKGTTGTFQVWAYGSGGGTLQNQMGFNHYCCDAFPSAALTEGLQENTGTSSLTTGTQCTASQILGSLHDLIEPYIGTAAWKIKVVDAAPGTSGLWMDVDTSHAAVNFYGNMSLYLFVGSTGGAPVLDLFISNGTGPALGTLYGTYRIPFASLPTGSYTRLSFPFLGTAPAGGVQPRFKIFRTSAAGYIEFAVQGMQYTYDVNATGTALLPLGAPRSGYFTHGAYLHRRGTWGAAGTNLLDGVTFTETGTRNTNDRVNVVLGPFFTPKYIFNEEAWMWAGYQLNWNGASFGTQEVVPAYRGYLDGVVYRDGYAILSLRNAAKRLKITTAERVTQNAGTATGTWWENRPLHFLMNELLTYGAAWGTNNYGTIDAREIQAVEIGTSNLTIGTTPPGTSVAAYYHNIGTNVSSQTGTVFGTSNNGTLYIGVNNQLFQAADPFSTWGTLGTIAAAWRIQRVYGQLNDNNGVAVGAEGVGGTYGLWVYRTGTFAMGLRVQYGVNLVASWGKDRMVDQERAGNYAFRFVDIWSDGSGTIVGLRSESASVSDIGTLVNNPSAGVIGLFANADVKRIGTTTLNFLVTADSYLFRFPTYGTLGTLTAGTFTWLGALQSRYSDAVTSFMYKNAGTTYFGMLAGGSMLHGLGTLGTLFPLYSQQEGIFPFRTWWMMNDKSILENYWSGTFGTVGNVVTGTAQQLAYVHAPSGTSMLLFPYYASGTSTIFTGRQWITPRVGTADWGAADVASIIGDFAEATGYVTYIDAMGKFVFRPRSGTIGTTGTITASDHSHVTIRLKDSDGMSPLINSMAFGLIAQAGSTVIQDTPSMGTYGTHNVNFGNPWFQDFDDVAKRAVMGQYVNRYRYPKRMVDLTDRYDPRRVLDEFVKIDAPLWSLSFDQTWRILALTHNMNEATTALTLREES